MRNTISLVALGITCLFALLTPEFLIGKLETNAINQDTQRVVQVTTKLYASQKKSKTFVGTFKNDASDGISYSSFGNDETSERCTNESKSVCYKDGTYHVLRWIVFVFLGINFVWKAVYHNIKIPTWQTEDILHVVAVVDIAVGVVWFVLVAWMFHIVSAEMKDADFQANDCQKFVDDYKADLNTEFGGTGWTCSSGTFVRRYLFGYWVHVALIVVSVIYTFMSIAKEFMVQQKDSGAPLTFSEHMALARKMVVAHWEIFAALGAMLIATFLFASVMHNSTVKEWTFFDKSAHANDTGCAHTFAARVTDTGVFDIYNTANEYESGSLLAELVRADAAKQVIPSLAAAYRTTTYDYQKLSPNAITNVDQQQQNKDDEDLDVTAYSSMYKRSIAKMLYTHTAARQSTDSIIKEQDGDFKAAHAPAFHSGTIQQGLGPAYMYNNPRHGTGFMLTIPVDLKPAEDANPKIDMSKQQNFEHPCENRPFDDNYVDMTGSTTKPPAAKKDGYVSPWPCSCQPSDAAGQGVVCVYNINVVGKKSQHLNAGRNSRVTLRWISREAIAEYEGLDDMADDDEKQKAQAKGPQPQKSEQDFAQSHLWAVAAQMIGCNVNGTVIQSADSKLGLADSADIENNCGLSGRTANGDVGADGKPADFVNSNTNIGVVAYKTKSGTKLPSPVQVEVAVRRAVDATVAGDNFVSATGKTQFGCSAKPAGGATLGINLCKSRKEMKDDEHFPKCLKSACELDEHNMNNIWVMVFFWGNVVLLICTATFYEYAKQTEAMKDSILYKYGPLVIASVFGIVACVFVWYTYYADYNIDFGLVQCEENDKFYASAESITGPLPSHTSLKIDETDEKKSMDRKMKLLFSGIFTLVSVVLHVVAIVRVDVAQSRDKIDGY